MVLSVGVEMMIVGTLATRQGALVRLGWAMIVGVVVMMVMVYLPRVSNGMSAVAAGTYVLETFETFVRHGLVMELKVKVCRIWNINKRPVWAVRAFWCVPAHVLQRRGARTLAT